MKARDLFFLIVGVAIGLWLAIQFYFKYMADRFTSMEEKTDDINHGTQQVRLAVGYLIKDQQEASVSKAAPRTPIGFRQAAKS